MHLFRILLSATILGLSMPAYAEIISASDTHFVLRHEATDARSAEDLWERLINPASWWHPDHTYSGDAANLSLDPRAGGLWRESWDGGSVAHGEVLLVETGKMLRMNAPFGPLQGVGAYTIWTITITPDGDASRVVFDEVSTAPAGTGMDELAEAVDFVKTEAISRLVSGPATRSSNSDARPPLASRSWLRVAATPR